MAATAPARSRTLRLTAANLADPACDAELLRSIALDGDLSADLHDAAAANPSLPTDTLWSLLRSGDPAPWRNPQLPLLMLSEPGQPFYDCALECFYRLIDEPPRREQMRPWIDPVLNAYWRTGAQMFQRLWLLHWIASKTAPGQYGAKQRWVGRLLIDHVGHYAAVAHDRPRFERLVASTLVLLNDPNPMLGAELAEAANGLDAARQAATAEDAQEHRMGPAVRAWYLLKLVVLYAMAPAQASIQGYVGYAGDARAAPIALAATEAMNAAILDRFPDFPA